MKGSNDAYYIARIRELEQQLHEAEEDMSDLEDDLRASRQENQNWQQTPISITGYRYVRIVFEEGTSINAPAMGSPAMVLMGDHKMMYVKQYSQNDWYGMTAYGLSNPLQLGAIAKVTAEHRTLRETKELDPFQGATSEIVTPFATPTRLLIELTDINTYDGITYDYCRHVMVGTAWKKFGHRDSYLWFEGDNSGV